MNSGVNWQSISDIYIENADYFRLQNLTLCYDFKTIWKSCPFQKLRLYVAAQNLFTITGYKGMDPAGASFSDSSVDNNNGLDMGAYPNPRTFTFGVRLNF